MKSPRSTYIPALKYHALTRYYDWVASLTTREKIFKTALVNQAAPLAGKHLLDVGCGTGTLTQMFAEREPSLTITGLDADSGALELAKTKFASMDQRVSLWQGFAQDMPFETATFDVAVSSLFFHHLTRLQKLDVLKQIHRVLNLVAVYSLLIGESLRHRFSECYFCWFSVLMVLKRHEIVFTVCCPI